MREDGIIDAARLGGCGKEGRWNVDVPVCGWVEESGQYSRLMVLWIRDWHRSSEDSRNEQRASRSLWNCCV